ncbi:hypothetical protein RJZ56_007722 [Blastomyces dermatitidis]|uniref:Uncharacterized protein n=3 Tax=Blastomyces TaxID=229219 RepID=A0A179UCC7_BLAGS|nr:uncharacterized protein BDBG_00795 [Blastomyces gilchristii SLH14081]XP_031576032.1 hypothetical protein, variant [Blastomyces gilchristii SLH14081]XP_045281599.1 uncharacterized protein BDCG_06233 [Blastomyces dermatitidis ER-3]XP_045281600.1 hypothetical protein, variant [Blastomyces dermatitidis ER-3]EGE82754.1 hypothetical protein BDDG_05698 [Blastomyces dermatitidis ATCC 18188]EQL27764.1 hypothetical protein BDFG_09431 [Blastomyces dermatitidis ATCC 26199]EQL27765.1 hypothetical prote
MPRRAPDNMALSVRVEANLFTAMKATAFSTYPGDTLAHVLAARLDRVQPQGPRGQWSPVRVIPNIDDDPDQGVDNQCWTLTTDPTIYPNNPEWFDEYVTQSIKIISPPYFIHGPGWEADFQRVFSQRSEHYNPIVRYGIMYTEYNPSTSLNVRIGNGTNPGAGFPFHIVRNLAMILLVYEPEIDRMLRLHTFPAHQNNPRRWLTPLQSPHFRPPNLPHSCPPDMLASHLLNTCPDLRSVVRAMNPSLTEFCRPNTHSYYKYDFSSLLDPTDEPTPTTNQPNGHPAPPQPTHSKRKTVQFRLPSNLVVDPEILIHWVRLLASLVEFAKEVQLDTLNETLGVTVPDLEAINNNQGDTTVGARPPEFASVQPPGSLLRLFTAMEQAQIPLDSDTARFWHRRRTRA